MESIAEDRSILQGQQKEFPRNITIHQYFRNGFITGRLRSDNLALVDGEKQHTFHQLDEISTKIAEAILECIGIGREVHTKNFNPDGDPVIGVCIQPSDRLITILFGILKAGTAYVPFDIAFPEERILRIVKDCRPLLIICDGKSNVMGKFEGVKKYTKVISTDEFYRKIQPFRRGVLKQGTCERKNPAEETAIILYTSGSSGEPKGVRLSHRAVMNRLSWQWNQFPFAPREKCVFKTSLTFVDSVAEIFGPLLQGVQLIVFDKLITSQPPLFIEKLNAYEITRLVLVPSLLKAMFQTLSIIGKKDGQVWLNSLRLWVCSGEAMSYEILSDFFENFPKNFTLCNFYGSTEVMGDVTFVSYSSLQDLKNKTWEKRVPIGYPLSNTSVSILNNDMDPVEIGCIGEIFIFGCNLARGYVGIRNSDKFLPIKHDIGKKPDHQLMYRTGDFGRIVKLPNGDHIVIYEGRIDSQVKVRGQRVDLSEIEATISRFDPVSKVKVLCYHPGEPDQSIVAYIVPNSHNPLEQIKENCEISLREYERPIIRLIDEIPLLVNGKTDRQRLLKMFEAEMKNREEFDEWDSLKLPQNKLETAKTLLKVISQVTGTSLETVAENLDDSFFNIGGTSLNTVMVIVKLREQNYYISIPEFTSAQTIREILMCMTKVEEDKEKEAQSGWINSMRDEYVVSTLTDKDREEAVHIISYSFSKKGDLEAYVNVTYNEFATLVESIWKDVVEKQFSMQVTPDIRHTHRTVYWNSTGEAVAVSLSFDVYDEPNEADCSDGIKYVMEFLEHVESQQRQVLPKGKGKLLHSFMMGSPEEIDDSEKVKLIEFLEEENLRIAKEHQFVGILTTNTNPLTMQIGRVHGYETLCEYQVNEYVAPNGKKPFGLAPDSFKIICCWKKLD